MTREALGEWIEESFHIPTFAVNFPPRIPRKGLAHWGEAGMRKKTIFKYPGRCYLSGYFLKCDATCKYHPQNPTETRGKCTEEETTRGERGLMEEDCNDREVAANP